MTPTQTWITFFIFVGFTMLTRFITFIIFPEDSNPPQEIIYLGSVLPTAAMGLIVVFALRETTILSYPYAIPELIAALAIILVHYLKRNTIISISVGTILYMFLVQVVF
ncbi:branched-chain amino acid transporter permease [Aerococcaceae bacterium WGS1372]